MIDLSHNGYLFVGDLSPDERKVIELLLGRLRTGRDVYGSLDLATDKRKMRREMLLEIIDALHYGAMDLIREDG